MIQDGGPPTHYVYGYHLTLVTYGTLGYVPCQKGVPQGHPDHNCLTWEAPGLCPRIVFRAVFSLDVTRGLLCQTESFFLYAHLKNGRIMPWQCPSVCPAGRPRFPDFPSTCFELSIWNLVYTYSRWPDMSSLSCITIGSLWPSLQPKVGQTHFLQS